MATPKIRRFNRTRAFVQKHLPNKASLLDLGTPNSLSDFLGNAGYTVQNTKGENLDTDYHAYLNTGADCVTAFEIFEHMLAPFNILSQIHCDKLIASVPLKLWFTSAYWNTKDDWDKHYHEFEQKQFAATWWCRLWLRRSRKRNTGHLRAIRAGDRRCAASALARCTSSIRDSVCQCPEC